jgi:hypothetical protein
VKNFAKILKISCQKRSDPDPVQLFRIQPGLKVPNPDPQHWLKASNHHSHLGKVEESILGEVGSSLLYEGEVRQVDAQVGDAGRVTPRKKVNQSLKGTV